jgi:hypothetical protein
LSCFDDSLDLDVFLDEPLRASVSQLAWPDSIGRSVNAAIAAMTAQPREQRTAVGAILSADNGNPGFPPE